MNSLVNKNKSEFANWANINWLNPYEAQFYQDKRDKLLKNLGDSLLFSRTKPYNSHISKGCSLCGSGEWSCLFITNKCNAACFYCPTAQNIDEIPSTQSLEFPDPMAYAEYINYFNFKAVSFSGGEPLLYFNRTLEYLKALRKQCSKDIYIWLYTNGILVTDDKLKTLAENGLDEIRFDIGATGFNLEKVKLAKGIIPVVTVEIPVVPEEKEKLIGLLPEMVKAGVNNLNLHQLRLTQYNAAKLLKREYTFINAEKPLVMESELTALKIINEAKKLKINMGINYCSFHFKNRFQKAGFRRMITGKMCPMSYVTENGYIREFEGNILRYKVLKLDNKSNSTENKERIELDGNTFFIKTYTVFKEIIPTEYLNLVADLLLNKPFEIPVDPLLFSIWQYEYIEHGLRDY